MKILLISTYELGRQPFGLASPAAWLRNAGWEVACADLSRQILDEDAVRTASLIAFYVPMHTAARLALAVLPRVRQINSAAHICFYGLYAPMNEALLRGAGAQAILGGEFEEPLLQLAKRIAAGQGNETQTEPIVSLARQKFLAPERALLPLLREYAQIQMPDGTKRVAGYTEASRGCKHLCRHCPIVPVYNGAFRIVQRKIVLADIRRQVVTGAQHVTFGDPDFFNGIGHAIPLVEELHREFPALSYDVTIKIEHLLKHREHLRTLRETGCLFVTSAVESVDNAVLVKLDKHHTHADFLDTLRLVREISLVLQPTFVPFTPWITLESYAELLQVLREQNLEENVAPIQLAIRLLIPAGSRLLELSEISAQVGNFDAHAMVYPWKHRDPRVDALCGELQRIVHTSEKMSLPRWRIFDKIENATLRAMGGREIVRRNSPLVDRAAVPFLTEPWYC